MSVEAMKLALAAFETLTQYNMVRANIFRRFEPTCTGDYVDLREFREKAAPVITALQKALAQPQQEPVAKVDANDDGYWADILPDRNVSVGQLLYTSPPAQEFVCSTGLCHYRKPLTDDEIANILPDDDTPMSLGEAFVKFARAIEAAHGIKENRNETT